MKSLQWRNTPWAGLNIKGLQITPNQKYTGREEEQGLCGTCCSALWDSRFHGGGAGGVGVVKVVDTAVDAGKTRRVFAPGGRVCWPRSVWRRVSVGGTRRASRAEQSGAEQNGVGLC